MNEPKPSPIVGIDLGTTFSLVAIYQDRRVRLLAGPTGEVLLPSVVAVDPREGHGITTGTTALHLWRTTPENGVGNFKRTMGTERKYGLHGRQLSSTELSAYVLDSLRAIAEAELGEAVTRAVITVPAYFNEAQKRATSEAAALAGLVVERLLTEPAAAALAFGLHEQQTESSFAVVDLGGGTFDVCIMDQFEGVLQVRSVAGEAQLGGNDFNLALRELVLGQTGRTLDDLSPDGTLLLDAKLEQLKRVLSRWPATQLQLPDELGGGTLQVTREAFERAAEPLLRRIERACREALTAWGSPASALDSVVLVGGATRMPCISAAAERVFQKKPRALADPDTLVAQGAAIQAALLAQDASVQEVMVTDVASHSLGVEEARYIGNTFRPGYFHPIIARNTTLPTSRALDFGIVSPNQRQLLIRVLEGESRRAEENEHIGQIEIKDLPPGPPRDVVKIRFTFDVSGLLEVSVTRLDTGKEIVEVFERGQRKLSGEALESARQRLRALKVNPRIRPRYRELLARAEALWKGQQGAVKERLGLEIDAFEAALETHTPVAIEKAYRRLEQACGELAEKAE